MVRFDAALSPMKYRYFRPFVVVRALQT